jgi:MEMO1 family protein
MPIIFSAIVPHTPLLLPSIGKENLKFLDQTLKGYATLEKSLYARQPDTIVIISPHGDVNMNSFSLNLCPQYQAEFSDFGDLATKKIYQGNVMLAHKIRECLETKAPLQLVSVDKLDYGCSVPLQLLVPNIPKIKIIPLYYSGLSYDAHYQFGLLFKKELGLSPERIAVIASGDLSHKLTKQSPAGYSPKAKKFDKKLIDSLMAGDREAIINTDPALATDMAECGLKSILILLGMIDNIKYTPRLYSYEFPFGVGYLTMRLKF